MTEHRFKALDGREWVTIDYPSEEVLASYPEGTIEIPMAPVDITPDAAAVDVERDRRISSGFVFEGVKYQSRAEDRENISGASTAALAAIFNGAEAGDYRWHGGDSDFVWIAEDNSTHSMDAPTMFLLGQMAMEHKRAHIFAGRALKDADVVPGNYTSDQYWPQAN